MSESAAYNISRLDDPLVQLELADAVAGKRISRDGVAEEVRRRVGKRNVRPKAAWLSCKSGHISVTVSSGQPLTFDDLMSALDHIRKQAKKTYDDGKDIAALARLLRAS